ncbi:MAG: hypothetical protein U5L11_12670 [Arhodomonas sp.]|nr:hypothetical protein [Arhodomonas sp.]
MQVSLSTPKRSLHASAGPLLGLATCGFTRRCLFSMHSDSAMITFGPV